MKQTLFLQKDIDSLNIHHYKDINEEWKICYSDPGKILYSNNILKIDPRYKLICLSHKKGYGTFIYAVPISVNEFDSNEYNFIASGSDLFYSVYPKPKKCLNNYFDAVIGDGSHLSYLYSIIVSRYFNELEVDRHGYWQGEIITAIPKSHPKDEWKWNEPEPENWSPTIIEKDGKIIANLYAYNRIGTPVIYKLTYLFKKGYYAYTFDYKVIAEGSLFYDIIV